MVIKEWKKADAELDSTHSGRVNKYTQIRFTASRQFYVITNLSVPKETMRWKLSFMGLGWVVAERHWMKTELSSQWHWTCTPALHQHPDLQLAWPGMFLLCQPIQAPTQCKSEGERAMEMDSCQASNISGKIKAAAQSLLSSSCLVHSHF